MGGPDDGADAKEPVTRTVRPESTPPQPVDVAAANAVAQAVLVGQTPEHLDEGTVQAMLDSLASPLPATRIIQARAITRIWDRCDGAVAESVGLAAFEHVSERPAEFFGLFPKEIPDQEMPVWADMVAQELLIDHEEDPIRAMDGFAAELRRTCREQGAPQDAAIERFRLQVRSRLADLTRSH
jgi:hypothetical protein